MDAQDDERKKGRLERWRESAEAATERARTARDELRQQRGREIASFAGIKLFDKWIDGGPEGGGPVAGAVATVDTAGAIDRRLSATRVVLTGGLGLFWKKKVDKRELYLLIEGDGFGLVKQVDPDKGKAARSFAAEVNRLSRSGATPPPTSAPAAESSATDPSSEIRKFAALRDEGLITDAEFESQKRKILGDDRAG